MSKLSTVHLGLPNEGVLAHGIDNALLTRDLSEFQHAIKTGNAFTYGSTTTGLGTGGDTAVFISNSSRSRTLVIQDMRVAGLEAATVFTFHFPTYLTLSGTALTAQNMNRDYSSVAEAEVLLDEQNHSQANIFHFGYAAQYAIASLPAHLVGRIRLGYHQCIALDIVTEQSDAAHCGATIYFVDN